MSLIYDCQERSSQPRQDFPALLSGSCRTLRSSLETKYIHSTHVIMSGIEVAGLVLTAFPIIASGLKYLTEGLGTIENRQRYQKDLARYSRTLETQKTVYLDTTEILLEGIIQSNDELEAFMKDPGVALSRNPHYEEQLSKRLGRSYDSYKKITAHLLDTLRTAREQLGIDETGKVCLVPLL